MTSLQRAVTPTAKYYKNRENISKLLQFSTHINQLTKKDGLLNNVSL